MNKQSKPVFLLAGGILAYICGGAAAMLMAVFLPDVVKDLAGNSEEGTMSSIGPWLNAAFLAGMTLGGLAIGVLSDRFGRVYMLVISLMFCSLGTLVAVRTSQWTWLAVFRMIAGAGVSGILLTCAVLLSEQWEKKSVAIAQGILGLAFPLGIILSGGLNILFSNWRDAFGAVGIAALLLVPVSWFAFSRYNFPDARSGKAPTPLFALFNPENRSTLLEGILVYGFDLVGLWAIFSWMPTWVDSLIDKKNEAGQFRGITMMLLGGGGLIGTAVSGYLVNWFGLRRVLLTNFIGTLGLCLLLFTTNHSFSNIILLETVALSLFFGVSQGALTVYVTELFPPEVRASGTGLCFNAGRFFTTSAVFFVGSLVVILGGYAQAMLVFSSAFLVSWLFLYRGNASKQTSKL